MMPRGLIPILRYTSFMYLRGMALAAMLAAGAAAAPSIPQSEYRERRQALRKAQPNSVTILFGATQAEHGDLRSGFFQEPNF